MNLQDVQVGISFPCNAMDPLSRAEIDRWIEVAVGAGYSYVSLGDHVLGIDVSGLGEEEYAAWARHYPNHSDARSPYDYTVIFREPFVIGSYMAAVSPLHIATGILVLPQRQTAVVAKQAAELDLLSEGRLRLGVGVGWNHPEYEALGAPFPKRRPMLEEQIRLLQQLWTQDVVDFDGEFHKVHRASLQMLPVQRPIPIWVGGYGPTALRLVGRLCDGWHPSGRVKAGEEAAAYWEVVRGAAREAGRDPDAIGVEPRLFTPGRTDDDIRRFVDGWRPVGMTHLIVDTREGAKRESLDEHLRRTVATAKALGLTSSPVA